MTESTARPGACRFLDEALARTLAPYTPGEQPKDVADLLKLNTNENPYPPSPQVVSALAAQDPADARLYPDPEATSFKQALSETFGRPISWFSVGNGSDELLAMSFLAFAGQGIAFPDVAYGFYPTLAGLFGRKVRIVALHEDFTWSPDDYHGIRETVVIPNPNAPTGIAAPLDDVRALLAQDADRLVIMDEAYVDFGAASAVSLLDDFDNLLVLRTMSKSRSLAGARIAFSLSNPEIARVLEAVRFSFNPYNLDRAALVAGAAACRDAAYFEQTRERVMATRERTASALRGLGCTVLPSAANFLFVRPPAAVSAPRYVSQLRERGIIVRYFNAPRTSGHVRVSIGLPQDMDRFIAASAEIFDRKDA